MLKNLFTRIKLLFLKDKELYYNLRPIIGFYPGKITLYKLALSHKSIASHNRKGQVLNNERLEFLGDAILGAVVGHIVFKHFPGKREGFLTTTRSKLVQREMLGKLAKEMGVTDLLHSSNSSISHNSYIGGNAFEALVGAIYLDKGYNACMRFVENKILANLVNIDKVAYKEVNFKSKLLEWAQKNHIQVNFEMFDQAQDANGNPTFEYSVKVEGVMGCKGKGYSKKEAQQKAARQTLEKLKKNGEFIDSIFAAKANRQKAEESNAKRKTDRLPDGGKQVENAANNR